MQWKISTEEVEYPQAIEFMEQKIADIYAEKSDECVWLLEHPPLYTAGTSADKKDLLDASRFPVFQTGRGGEHTYHGTGQMVAYVMLNLRKRQTQPDIKQFIYNLEQWIINTLEVFGIKGEIREGRVGIWVVNPDGSEDKIAAIGIRIRKWVTYHGIAINLNPNLEHFSGIVPCGISQHGVTSFEKLGVQCNKQELEKVLLEEFAKVFNR